MITPDSLIIARIALGLVPPELQRRRATGGDLSREETGQFLGLSRYQIGQVEERAMEKLKDVVRSSVIIKPGVGMTRQARERYRKLGRLN